ncbi:MAG: expansin EXLX1 family cellulose-binding protein [Lachnospiraceae bacterium]
MKKKISVFLLIICMIGSFFQAKEQPVYAASKIGLSSTKATLYRNQLFTLKYNGAKSKVKWSVSNTKVRIITATSNTVKLRAMKLGTAKVTAQIGSKKKVCEIKVEKIKEQQHSGDAEEYPEKVTATDLKHRKITQKEFYSSFPAKIHRGEGTFYGGGYGGGCCKLDSITNGYYVCAMNLPDYDTAQMAGAFIEIKGPKGKVRALVSDELPEGKKGDVDLNTDIFPMIAERSAGRVNITWKILPLPTDEPVKYLIQKSSTQYWMQLQVRNHRYPIKKTEMKINGKYQTLKKENYNFYTIQAPGKGPYKIRLTDMYGQVLYDTIKLKPGVIQSGKENFPS